MHNRTALARVGFAAALLFAVPTLAQDAEPTTPPVPTPESAPEAKPAPQAQVELGDLLARCDGLPPQVRAGVRASVVREFQVVADTVVLVETPEAAAAAISKWRGLGRYPVLIDDGSIEATENTARFVRAFRPSRVVRWAPLDTDPWPDDTNQRALRIIQAVGGIIETEDTPQNVHDLLQTMRDKRVGPQGAVAIDPDDPAWPAGLALAAGRFQIVLFFKGGGRVNRVMPGQDMRGLADFFQNQLNTIGANWGALGDEIDVLTLAGSTELRVGLGEDGKDEKALTDLLGRNRGGIGTRWAWAGVVFGDAQTALYRAMSAMFLNTDSAWLFDGYGRGDPWDLYDATSAGRILDEAGYNVEVHDTPNNRVADWRRACLPGVDAGLILINSKGPMSAFDLAGDTAYSGDIPLLDRPAAIHIVHSWSARMPAAPTTIAGRWLDHGAYLYYGSIDEPFLNAFVETPAVAQRLIAGVPFGVAVRRDDSPAWKLNVLGDPLTTFIPNAKAGRRAGPDVPLAPLDDVGEGAAWLLKNKSYAPAIHALVLSNRDNDAARLAAALVRQEPDAFGNEAARWSIMPLYRAGNYDALAAAYAMLAPDDQKTLLFQDALWEAGRSVLARGPDTRMEGLLRRNLRDGQQDQDAIELAAHIASRAGAPEAVAFLEGVMPDLKNDRQRANLNKAVRVYGGSSTEP
ncbi:MAG: hypothetical protein H6810_05185 [Phycisphaeraceae bacterium]|nr:MAG: hypothetical protein H6810_05185 [Phycisphaeraceae bacterium]